MIAALTETPSVTQFSWQAAAFVAAVSVALVTTLLLAVYKKFDRTGGLLTLSVLIVQGFITASFASMIYNVPQNPVTEILIGALATSLGAVVAYWMSGTRPTPKYRDENPAMVEGHNYKVIGGQLVDLDLANLPPADAVKEPEDGHLPDQPPEK